jgi:HD superfamily phosphohydrolase
MSESISLFGEGDEERRESLAPPHQQYSFSSEQIKILEGIFKRPARHPLFVIGSGVSLDCGVPSMKNVFLYLQAELTKRNKYPAQAQDQRIVEATLRLASSLASGPGYRPMAARLFGELQDSKVQLLSTVWDEFCLAFLSGRIDSSGAPKATGSLVPSKAHESIARLYDSAGALCLSFNFDGLTKAALQKHFSVKGEKVFILDGWEKIREFYGRDPGGPRCHPIFKVRGDIFYAACKTSGCPAQGKPTPVYEFRTDTPYKDSDKWAKAVIACPECKAQRSLRISFPGLEQKEQETDEIVRELWRYVVPGLSSIFVVGLSGVWDEPIVRDLLRAAQLLNLPFFDVKPPAAIDDFDTGYISRICQESFPTLWDRYQRIASPADDFMPALEACAIKILTSRKAPTESRLEDSVELDKDGVWVSSNVTNFSVHIPGRESNICLPDSSGSLAYGLANDREVQALKRFSQLGLKNYWWGDKSFGHHNRYLHSVGTLQVAAGWHKSLFEAIRKNYRQSWRDSDLESENDLLMAALTHDFGHLPFSHLFEEIFEELHWSIDPLRRTYSHVQYGAERVRDLLQTARADKAGRTYSNYLANSHYGYEDVLALIEGRSGVPYLDAIINSPVDADKIDYIFRDSSQLSIGVKLMPRHAWLGEFLADQDISPEGLLRLNGRSALRLLELLETRRSLYLEFYVAPWIRAMEAIVKTIIVKYLLLYTSAAIFPCLRAEVGTRLSPDWGERKIRLTTKRIAEEYARVDEEERRKAGTNQRLEQPLLRSILRALTDSDIGESLDDAYRRDFLGQLDKILTTFDDHSPEEESGTRLRKVYQELHLAGPFRIPRNQEYLLREVVRELELLFPDKVLFAISKAPRFLATADHRRYDFRGSTTIGENVLVPSDRPSGWTMKARARVPLHSCDFRAFESPFVEVTLIDPWQGGQIAGRYVLDLFKRRCKETGIEPTEP